MFTKIRKTPFFQASPLKMLFFKAKRSFNFINSCKAISNIGRNRISSPKIPLKLNVPHNNFGFLKNSDVEEPANHQYSNITSGFLMEVYNSSAYLFSLHFSELSESIEIFLQNLFPIEDNRSRIIANLIKLQESKEIRQSILIKTPEKFENNAEKSRYLSKAHDIYRHLKNILEFLDKGNRGLLSGDLNEDVIKVMQESILEMKDRIIKKEFDQNPSIKAEVLSYIYDQVCKIAFESSYFKLPKKGIPYPECENPRNLFERQLILEDDSNEQAIEKFMMVYEDLQNYGLACNLKFARKYIIDWFPILTKAVKEEQDLCIAGDMKGDRKNYGAYLSRISSEKLSLLALNELMKSILNLTAGKEEEACNLSENETESYFIVSKKLFTSIGRAINAQMIFDYEEAFIKDKERENNKKIKESKKVQPINSTDKNNENLENNNNNSNNNNDDKNNRKQKLKTFNLIKKNLSEHYFHDVSIPPEIQIKIGSLMVYFIKETIKLKNEHGFWVPLLTPGRMKFQEKTKLSTGILYVNDTFVLNIFKKMDKTNSLFVQLERSLPMIYKPAPWQDYELGTYFQKPTKLMRVRESAMQENAIKYADLHKIFHVLDLLSQTAWRINRKVLNVAEKIWELGGGKGEIPKRLYDYQDYVYKYQIDESYGTNKFHLMKKMQAQRDLHSLRCDFMLKLNVAKGFSNISKIYFPHNVDFRGRVYPIPPHLNHMGADLARGLLEFSEGKPIGKRGIYWLKIHLANKMGKDKLSFSERIAFVDSMLGLVEKIAEDPISNQQWLEFEDCWQSLAAIFDLYAALKHPNPEQYISHLHIHQDGSCNGLQHYAALGRDEEGAKQVNLSNNERPGDIYTHVANMIARKVDNDSQNPNSKYHNIALKLKGNIKRKVVKQTVMTSVYGVTFIGARKQILKQLKDLDAFSEKDVYEASYYMALLTLDSIKDLFSGAHEIKKWLIQCADLISQTKNPVSWITPFGLPIVQPYRSKTEVDCISTVMQTVVLDLHNDNLAINKSKQRSAFPPNFIHSLDSTHLMYTVVECKKENITFAAVHDSFWTHVCTTDRMNQILREQFVKLHSQPLLEDLKKSFEIRFPDLTFPEIPQRGNFNLEKVKMSDYFFA